MVTVMTSWWPDRFKRSGSQRIRAPVPGHNVIPPRCAVLSRFDGAAAFDCERVFDSGGYLGEHLSVDESRVLESAEIGR